MSTLRANERHQSLRLSAAIEPLAGIEHEHAVGEPGCRRWGPAAFRSTVLHSDIAPPVSGQPHQAEQDPARNRAACKAEFAFDFISILEHECMNILLVERNRSTRPLYLFFDGISEGLCIKIFNKFQSYVQHGDVYQCKHLKTLNSKIWKYKGTIYKLRVDNGNESARVLFSRSKDGGLKIVHAFLKSTRKTPAKEARQAIAVYQALECLDTVVWDEQSIHGQIMNIASKQL